MWARFPGLIKKGSLEETYSYASQKSQRRSQKNTCEKVKKSPPEEKDTC